MKNKRKYNWAWLILVFFEVLHAAPIAVDVAENNALQWMKSKNHQNYTIKKQLFANGTTKSKTKKNTSKYRILELEPKGWVIVSLDDVIKPIIGYGDSKIDINNIPPALIEYLSDVEKVIEYRNTHVSLVKKKRKELLYSANNNEYIVRPLLWLGSTEDTEEQGIVWGQGRTTPPEDGYTYTESNYYNTLTPEWEPGNHTYTGCVATAMGQIMRYWKYPSVGKGQHCYTPQTHPEYGEQCVNFGATAYDWDNMPLTLTSENYDVAQILYHAGVAVDMDYTKSGSGAFLGDQMKTYFSYNMRAIFSRGEGMELSVKEFLNLSIPLIVSGRNNSSGHLYIVDGYDGDGYYHFNWGWNGMSNGRYTLESGTWGYVSNRFTAVSPTDPSSQITISDSHFASCIVDQLSLEDSSEIKELSLKYTESLDCRENNISSVEELSYFKHTHYLYLQNNNLHGTLNLSSITTLSLINIDHNNISTVVLPNSSSYYYISLDYNPNLNILEIENLKNIQSLYAYGTQNVACWQKNTLAIENNITNIYMGCSSSQGDNMDTDGDGISNVDDPDDDNDGINDLEDDDIDGDGVLDSEDAFPLDANESLDTDHDGIGNNADSDDDNDGISDTDERKWGFDPLDASNGGSADADGDGVSNADEIESGSNPLDASDTKKPKKFVPIIMDDMVVMVPLVD